VNAVKESAQHDDGELRIHYRSTVVENVTALLNIWWSPRFQRDVVGERHRDLSTIEVRLLWTLGSLGPSRPSELADALTSGAPSVSKAAARLESSGLVTRRPSPDDHRSHLLELTKEGRRITQDLYDVGDAMVAEIFTEWDDRDAAALGALLERFVGDSRRYARRIRTDTD
jgi:DNA-binding MarR family transcriptional regulator